MDPKVKKEIADIVKSVYDSFEEVSYFIRVNDKENFLNTELIDIVKNNKYLKYFTYFYPETIKGLFDLKIILLEAGVTFLGRTWNLRLFYNDVTENRAVLESYFSNIVPEACDEIVGCYARINRDLLDSIKGNVRNLENFCIQRTDRNIAIFRELVLQSDGKLFESNKYVTTLDIRGKKSGQFEFLKILMNQQTSQKDQTMFIPENIIIEKLSQKNRNKQISRLKDEMNAKLGSTAFRIRQLGTGYFIEKRPTTG